MPQLVLSDAGDPVVTGALALSSWGTQAGVGRQTVFVT